MSNRESDTAGAQADRATDSESRAAPAGQRRQVTVLFVDVADFTPLAERLGEERTYLLVQRITKTLSEAVHAQEGTVQEFTGDGLMAVFGAPLALEDAPLRACRAALEMQDRIRDLGREVADEHGASLAVRVGLNSGPVIVGQVGDAKSAGLTALGDTVNLAARLEGVATPGDVVMSKATHDLVEGFVEATPQGERTIKGKAEPVEIWRLDGIKEGVVRFDVSQSRGLTALIGRRRELEQLEATWREAANGAVRVVGIVGEAGLGKSRLVHEFRARLGEGGAFFLNGQCTAEGQTTPFRPFIEVVRTSFRIPDAADAKEVERKLTNGLAVLGLQPETTLPYLKNLLGLTTAEGGIEDIAGEVLGIRTREAILAMLRERCHLSPTVLYVDDLHWIDTASEELLQRAVEEGDGLPLLIICTYRPEYRAPWAGRTNASEIRLAPLSEGSTAELLEKRLAATNLPEAFTRMVIGKSEGNPLFAEEIANYLLDSGSLTKDADGVRYNAAADDAVLPVTLENLLMGRFDRLADGPRAVLEAASIIGPRFSAELAGKVARLDGEISGHLAELQRLELIRQQPSRGDYDFKHALVRDAIYDSLLTARREALHERAAEALEARHAGYADEAADVLAYHWSHTPRADKAVKFLALAGKNSLQIYSLEEAEQNFRRALSLIEANPASADDAALTEILLNLARVLYFQFQFFEIIRLVEKYLPRVEALGDRRRLSRFLFEGGYAHVFAANVEDGRKLLNRARAIGEEIDDEVAIAYADLGFMWDRMFWGQPGDERRRAQVEAGERIAEIGKRHGDIWLASKALLALGLDAAAWGRPGEGRAAFLSLLALSRESNDPRPRSMGLWGMAALNMAEGNYDEAIQNAEESLRVCLSPVDRFAAQSYKDFGHILLGRTEALHDDLFRIFTTAIERGLIFNMAMSSMGLGILAAQRGDLAGGVRRIEEAVARYRALGQAAIQGMGDEFLGRIFMEIALGDKRPSFAVMARNAWFLLRVLPNAEKRARRHFERAAAHNRTYDMPAALARNLYDIGLLDRAKKRAADARARLEEAREIAAAVEATSLVSQIDDTLAELAPA